jgi:glycogen debranching enzyme
MAVAGREVQGNQWGTRASESPANERRRMLKQGETFAVFDPSGDIHPQRAQGAGIYHQDTRFLSRQELLIEGRRPLFLDSWVKNDSNLFVAELTNPDFKPAQGNPVAVGTLRIVRTRLLWDRTCHERLSVVNCGIEAVGLTLSMMFGADYVDLFEVRGFQRAKHGDMTPPQVGDGQLILGYRGLDGRSYRTCIRCEPEPAKLHAGGADFRLTLAPKEQAELFTCITLEKEGEAAPRACEFASALQANTRSFVRRTRRRCRISTSHPLCKGWLERSAADLDMLQTELPQACYPYAGLPWYAATFGRDGILTAHECLWNEPEMAKGVLAFLASTQADSYDERRDAEPGKILHEARKGELAALHAIPFDRYYGTVDATPLFVGLAGAWHERTGDLAFIRTIWDNVKRALQWMDHDGDADGDGFVEYAGSSGGGLDQQGWKDSPDSIFHRDGRIAKPPIALCEVQGYVYDAKLRAAQLAQALDEPEFARQLLQSAQALKQRFNAAFWCEEIGSYALALDGDKRQCKVAASNAGHALWTGIAEPELAARVAQRLLCKDMFCGWGVRTVGAKEARYNPMSYHNGSVWPHDNALIAAGLARYGFMDGTMKIFGGLLDAVAFMEQQRMPELFCGIARQARGRPLPYPVACAPQAWAAAAVFYLLQACLGLRFDPARSDVSLANPQLPPFLDWIEIHGLQIGKDLLDLRLQGGKEWPEVDIARRPQSPA